MSAIQIAGRPLLIGGRPLLTPPLGVPTTLAVTDYQGVFVGTDGLVMQQVFQRKPGGSTPIPVLFTYTGTVPSNIQARPVQRRGGAAVTGWTTLTGLTAGGGFGSGVHPSVPDGGDYLWQIRDGVTQPSSGPLFGTGTQRWGVGVRVWAAGQSNMNNTLGGGLNAVAVPGYPAGEEAAWKDGVDATTTGYPGAIYDKAGFHQPTNGNAMWGEGASGDSANNTRTDDIFILLRLVTAGLKAATGVDIPVALIPYAVNANSIDTFTPPSGVNYVAMVSASGHDRTGHTWGLSTPMPYASGGFEVFLYHQGEANAGDSQASYETALTTLYNGLLSYLTPYGFDSTSFKFLPMVIGTLAVSVGAGVENIRSAQQHWVAAQQTAGKAGVALGGTTIDLTRVPVGGGAPDDYHFTVPAVQRRSAKRLVQAALKALGAAPYGARGPILGTPSRASNVITWPVVHEAGTGLQGATGSTGITGFAVNTAADFSGTAITVTAAIVSGNVVLTLPSSGVSYPVYVKYMGGQIGTAGSSAPDISNPVYDNTVYPRRTGQTGTDADSEALGFPLLPTVGSVAVS